MRRWSLNSVATKVALLVVAVTALGVLYHESADETAAHHLCPNTGSPSGAFDIQTYEALDYKTTYARALELAATNKLFPEIASFAMPRVETGDRNAGSTQTADPYVPPVLLKAIAYLESGWAQGSYSPFVDYGQVGPVLASHDCGYGIMQVTSGMQNVSGVPALDQAMIGSHFGFNVARGVRILADKWNMSPELRPIIGNRDPALIENWYYAIWAYNGWAFSNHPLNPSYSPTRAPFSCGPASDGLGHDKSQYPYQELVMGCMQRPPVRLGDPLWPVQEVHLPDLNDTQFAGPMNTTNWNACSYSAVCQPMDIPTPNTNHKDFTSIALTREQVIGVPMMAVSATQLSFSSTYTDATAGGSFQVQNNGTGVLGYRATSNASWLRVSPSAGVALGSDLVARPGTVSVTVNSEALAPGTYAAQVKVDSLYASAGLATVSVTLTKYDVHEGTVAQGSGPSIYLIQGGIRRHIPNPATLRSFADWAEIVRIPDDLLFQYPEGTRALDVLSDGRLISGSGYELYVMLGHAAYHIPHMGVITDCGYSLASVVALPDDALSGVAKAGDLPPVLCPRFLPPTGTLVRGSSFTVMVMQEDLARPIHDSFTFEARGYRWGDVNVLPDGVLATISPGTPVLSLVASGALLQGSSAAVFAVDGATRRHVSTPSVMSACAYGFDAVLSISDALLKAFAEGPALGGPPCPVNAIPAHTLLKGSGPAVWVMDGSGVRHSVPNPAVFTACGYQWGNLDVVADSVLDRVPRGGEVSAGSCP